jgi:glycosyltransferase involved in cell wall biosynthesis
MLLVVGGIGLADAKGRDTLLDSWAEVRRGSPDATLAVLGGRVGDDSSTTVSDEGNGVFRLARPLLQAEYLGMIEAASVIWAVRDRVEGMSSTVDVAMHFGRPTIVSSINVSSSWFTRGAGGERVDPGDPRSIARGILRAFDASHVGRIDADGSFGGFTGAVDALAGRRRFTPADLPDRLRTGKRTG